MTCARIIVAALLGVAPTLVTASAHAQNARSFVSSQGSDSNDCSLSAPCRHFSAALSATVAGGEITVLDTADYGAVKIDKAISIVNNAGEATLNGVVAISVTAGSDDAVSLRGLTLDGPGFYGIIFESGKSLSVENCVIRNLSAGAAIRFATSNSSTLYVSNTLIANIGNGDVGGTGISVSPGGNSLSVRAVLNHVEIHDAYIGVVVTGRFSTGTLDVVVQDTVITGGMYGVFTQALSVDAVTHVMMARSTVANNWTGLYVGGGNATFRFSKSIVTGNTFGWTSDNDQLLSYGDNNIDGNDSPETAPPSLTMK